MNKICVECAASLGSFLIPNHLCSVSVEACDVCKQVKPVTEPRDFSPRPDREVTIVIIEQDLPFTLYYDKPCEDGTESDLAIEIQEICSSYSVLFKFSSTSTEDRFIIMKQELFLDEQEMTDLFANVLVFADYDIGYSLYDVYDEYSEYEAYDIGYSQPEYDEYALSLTPKQK